MSVLFIIPPVAILILSALALPPAVKEKSWGRFFIALILSFAGVVLPLFRRLADGVNEAHL